MNTYKWVNAAGETVLVKYHWIPKQGVKSWTAADAAAVQADELGAHSKDLYDAIEAGDYPEWELRVQMMSDDEHPELDFDPLDDTKVWPEEQFPPGAGRPHGARPQRPTTSSPRTSRSRSAPACWSTASTSPTTRCSSGRTFSYSDTQRHRVGPNYLQLPVNQPKNASVATNQRDGQMAYAVDDGGANPHVNYEPSITGGLREAPKLASHEQGPVIEGRLTRKRIPRTNDYQQAGERYLLSEPWERDDLVANLVDAIGQCDRPSRSGWSGTCSWPRTSSACGSARASASARRRPAPAAARDARC